MSHPEIGKELLAPQLELLPTGTVVVMIGTHRPDVAVTMRLVQVGKVLAAFDAPVLRSRLALRINAAGQFFDQNNHRIAIHKYRGEA